MSKLNFNAANVLPESKPDPIPAGWYNMMMVESEQKPTQTGGVRLAAVCKIIDGQYVNRQIYDNMNIQNSNPVAQEIALGRLSAYCHAVGVMNVTDTTQLHGKPFKAKVAIRAAKDGYDAQNEIKAIKHINEPVDGVASSTGVPTSATANVPSWATSGPAPAPVAAAAPVVAAAAPLPPAPAPVPAPEAIAEPVRTMTPLAKGATYESFINAGWKEDAMIAQGFMTVEQPAAPAPPVMPTAGGSAPPWGKK